jgi:hypothetical protein
MGRPFAFGGVLAQLAQIAALPLSQRRSVAATILETAPFLWSSENVAVQFSRCELVQGIEIKGVWRDLTHLNSFVVTLAGKGRDGADLRVAVHLGLHAVSRRCQPDEEHDFRDENGQPRVFCADRYAFSLGLREIITRMIHEKYFCWASSDRNRAVNFAVLDAAPSLVRQLNDGQYQVIYFYLYPSKGRRADVELYVKSCHKRFVRFGSIKRRFDTHMLIRKCYFEQKKLP